MTKKYKVTEMKGEKFQEAAIDSAQCCLPQIRKNSAREKRHLPLTGQSESSSHRQRKENLKIIKHLAMISFFSKSSLAYDSTLDDYKLMILYLLPKS